MNVQNLLIDLAQRGIRLELDNEQLRIQAPKGAVTAELKATLQELKPALVSHLRRIAEEDSFATIQPAPRGDSIPISLTQNRLWFLEQLGTGSAYNEIIHFKLDGPLNIQALRQALTEIVRRHEVLRTTIVDTGNGAVQAIQAPPLALALPYVDLRPLSALEQVERVAAMAAEEQHKLFDLGRDLMLRSQLLQLDQQTFVLILAMHHIAIDGWSQEILVRELSALYLAYCQGEDSPLPPLPIQYADFACWQQQWLRSETFAHQLRYWKKRLENAPPLSAFPTDHPRPALQTFHGRMLPLAIEADLLKALRERCQETGTTLFMALLATLQILLLRYSGQEDIVVSSPIASRKHKDLEGLIGFFVNTLPLRIDLAGNPTGREVLAQVRKTTLEAYEHQDVPFERLLEDLALERNLSHPPLLQVVFAFHRFTIETFDMGDVHAHFLPNETPSAHMDIEIHVWEAGGQLRGFFVYNTSLFEADTIERMVGHFKALLAGIVAAPDSRIGELPLLTEAERLQLAAWNRTEIDYPKHQTVVGLFEQQAEKTPHHTAVMFEGQSLSYAKLNARANQIAHRLLALRIADDTPLVRPDTLVAIAAERSLAMVAGLLGILKAGPPTCRSTRPTPRRASPSCWRTAPRRCCWPRPPCCNGCPWRAAARRCAWTRRNSTAARTPTRRRRLGRTASPM